jgi:hypothetical protein
MEQKAQRGAPIKYHDGVPDQLLNFFNAPLFQEIGGKTMPNFLPTIEKFCVDIGIATSTFYEWCKKYEDLSSAFEKAKHYQKNQLMQLSLLGFYKEGFAKFVAVNITDLRDKQETTHDISESAKKLVIDMSGNE